MRIFERFSHKLPTKGLVRVYLSTHPLVDLEGILLRLPRCLSYACCDHFVVLMQVTWRNMVRRP